MSILDSHIDPNSRAIWREYIVKRKGKTELILEQKESKSLDTSEVCKVYQNLNAETKTILINACNSCDKNPDLIFYGRAADGFLNETEAEEYIFTLTIASIPDKTYNLRTLGIDSNHYISDEYRKYIKTKNLKATISPKLSNREMEILKILCEGKSSKQAAAELYLSAYTIESHKQSIYKKLGIKTMGQLGRISEELGLI